MIAFVIGMVLAVVLGVAAKLTGYEKDKSFYPTILIVIASYYLLFSIGDGSILTITIETLVLSAFAIVGIYSGFKFPMIVGVAIILHGFFDFTHDYFYVNSGVPNWWPFFCAGVDIPLGLWVVYFHYKTSLRFA